MKEFLITCALGLALLGASSQAAQAQSGPVTTGPAPAPTGVPLDGGASLLLAAGVAAGLRKLRQRRPR